MAARWQRVHCSLGPACLYEHAYHARLLWSPQCLSDCVSVCLRDRLTDERVRGWTSTKPSRYRTCMDRQRVHDHVDVVTFWCWSDSGCGFRVTFSLPLKIRDREFYCLAKAVKYSKLFFAAAARSFLLPLAHSLMSVGS